MNEYQVFKSGPRKGQPKTLADRVVRFLVEWFKAQEVSSRSRYRQFVKNGHNYFVGKAGAVRAGKSANCSESITYRVHTNMRWWEAKLQATVDKCNRVLEG